MAFQPRTKPGSTSTTPKNYGEMSISELVDETRAAYQAEEFDKVEEELLIRDDKLKAEIVSLREKIKVERLKRIEAEEKLKKREEEYEKGVKSKEIYEKLLKKVKENGLDDKTTIEKVRQKNHALEREIFELKELEKKRQVDDKSVLQLRLKVRALEEEKVADKSSLDAIRMKNGELEETVKKNLTTIEELKTEKGKLEYEKCKSEALFETLDRKFSELFDKVGKMEDDVHLLMSVDSSGCGNNEVEHDPGFTCAVKEEENVGDYDLKNDIAGNARKENKDALGASGVRLKFEKNVEVINLDDDDDDVGCAQQGFHGKNCIHQIIAEKAHPSSSYTVQHKRKWSSDIETSTSTSISSADLLDLDNLPLSSRPIASEKRSKTSAVSSRLNPLPR